MLKRLYTFDNTVILSHFKLLCFEILLEVLENPDVTFHVLNNYENYIIFCIYGFLSEADLHYFQIKSNQIKYLYFKSIWTPLYNEIIKTLTLKLMIDWIISFKDVPFQLILPNNVTSAFNQLYISKLIFTYTLTCYAI